MKKDSVNRGLGSIHDEVMGVNPEGFVPLATLSQVARAVSAAEFAERYPVAALVLTPVGGSNPGTLQRVLPADLREQSFQRTKLEAVGPGAERYRDQAGFLAKRPGSPFPHMVSIGRAPNNDLVLALDTISKFHGYFTAGPGEGWTFTDGRATAGTARNGTRLEPGGKCELADGDWLLLGNEVLAQLFSPASLHARLSTGK